MVSAHSPFWLSPTQKHPLPASGSPSCHPPPPPPPWYQAQFYLCQLALLLDKIQAGWHRFLCQSPGRCKCALWHVCDTLSWCSETYTGTKKNEDWAAQRLSGAANCLVLSLYILNNEEIASFYAYIHANLFQIHLEFKPLPEKKDYLAVDGPWKALQTFAFLIPFSYNINEFHAKHWWIHLPSIR